MKINRLNYCEIGGNAPLKVLDENNKEKYGIICKRESDKILRIFNLKEIKDTEIISGTSDEITIKIYLNR